MSAILEKTRPVEPVSYRVADAAAALGISVRAVYCLIEQGRVRKVKIGRASVIPAADVRAIAEGGAV